MVLECMRAIRDRKKIGTIAIEAVELDNKLSQAIHSLCTLPARARLLYRAIAL